MEGNDNGRFGRLEHRSLREHVISALEQAIYTGKLKQGERLVELDIARELGISRAPVREAIRFLEKQGLVVSLPHRGTFVSKWLHEDIVEIYGLRSVLEGYAARLAAINITYQEVAELDSLVQRMFDAARTNDLHQIVALDADFHHHLCLASGHKRLLLTLQDIRAQTRMFIALTKAIYSLYDSSEHIATGHLVIVDALRRRDPDLAERVVKEHIEEVGEKLVAKVATEEELASAQVI